MITAMGRDRLVVKLPGNRSMAVFYRATGGEPGFSWFPESSYPSPISDRDFEAIDRACARDLAAQRATWAAMKAARQAS